MIEEMKQYQAECSFRGRAIFRWIVYDVWANALDENDGSKDYFKRTREEKLGPLEDIVEKRGGGDAAIFEDHKVQWLKLKERMAEEDGVGERKFADTGHLEN